MELDYDEDVGEEDGRGYEDKEKIDDSRGGENEVEKREIEEVRLKLIYVGKIIYVNNMNLKIKKKNFYFIIIVCLIWFVIYCRVKYI